MGTVSDDARDGSTGFPTLVTFDLVLDWSTFVESLRRRVLQHSALDCALEALQRAKTDTVL